MFAAASAAVPVLEGVPVGDSGVQTRSLAAEALALPGGRWIIAAVAAVVLFVTASMFYTGLRATFMGDLWRHRLSPRWRRVALFCGSAGTLARAIAIGGIGTLLAITAATGDATRAGSLNRVLRLMASSTPGYLSLAVIAAGIAAFGVYCIFDAYARRA